MRDKKTVLMVVVILIGIVLRFVVMPFTLHSDLLFIYQYPALFFLKGTWNIYEYIQTHFQDTISIHGWNYYPPATYLLVLGWQFILQLLSPTFILLMQKAFLFQSILNGPTHEFLKFAHDESIFRDIFLMKFPFLLFDCVGGALLLSMLTQKTRLNGAVYWFLNPFLIYAPYMFGQMDIIPAVLTLFGFSLLFMKKFPSAKLWAFVLFGLAAGFKLYPVLLFPPLLILAASSRKERLRLFLAFISVPILLTVLFFSPKISLMSLWFPSFVFKSIEQTFVAQIKQVLFIVLYVALVCFSWLQSRVYDERTLAGILISLFLGLYSLTQYHSLHYLVWMLPFLPFWFKDSLRAYWTCWLIFILLIGFRIMARPHQLGLLVPLDPVYFSSLPSLAELIGRVIPYRWISNITYIVYNGILLGMMGWIMINLIVDKYLAMGGRGKV